MNRLLLSWFDFRHIHGVDSGVLRSCNLEDILLTQLWTHIRGLLAFVLLCLVLSGCQTTSETAAVEPARTYDLAALKTATVLSRENLRFFPSSRKDPGVSQDGHLRARLSLKMALLTCWHYQAAGPMVPLE